MPWIAIAAFTLGLAACDPKPVTERANNGDGGGAKTVRTVEDLALNIKVEDALKANPALRSLSIRVRTAGGVTTLSGTADTAANRALAEQAARSVNGVKSVENKIVVGDA